MVGEMFNYNEADFEVEKFSLDSYDGYAVNSDIGVGLRRKDNKRALAIVSEAYEPVQYMDIIRGVCKAINLSGIDKSEAGYETNVYDNGARLELRARFPAHEIQIDKGDTVIPEFVFRTSHNRTWANNGMMGLWRFFCYNTLV